MRRKHLVGFWRQVSAKKPLLGALTITLLLTLVLLSSSLIQFSKVSKAATPSDFDNYQILTIDHTQVPSDLTNFPVLVYNSSWITGLNATSFTFFQPDNSTECNWELEKYDSSTGELVAWVNISSISSTTDTSFYLYYDSSPSSDGGENNPESTWDSNYVAVYHMDDSSGGITDSTSNNRDSTAVHGTPDYRQNGDFGWAINFNGSGETFDLPSGILQTTDSFTIFTIVKTLDVDGTPNLMFVYFGNGDIKAGLRVSDYNEADNHDDFEFYLNDGSIHAVDCYTNLTDTSSFHCYAGVFDTSSNTMYGYYGGKQNDSYVTSNDPSADTQTNVVGGKPDQTDSFIGVIEELRISDVARSQDYLTAVNNNIVNKTSFISWGAEISNQNTVSLVLHGTPSSDTVTHEGFAGDTDLLCNETGTYYEWIELNISIVSTPYPEFIQINVSDMPSVFTSANFSFQFTSDNSSWNKSGNWKTGSSGGWNFTINGSTWTTANGCYGSNPFTADGDGDGYNEIQSTTSIWIVEKCSIPFSASPQTYTDTDATKITGYVGYYS